MDPVGNIIPGSDPFSVIPKEINKKIWNRLVSPDRKNQNAFLITSKSNYLVVIKDNTFWRFWDTVRIHFNKGYDYRMTLPLQEMERARGDTDIKEFTYFGIPVITGAIASTALVGPQIPLFFASIQVVNTIADEIIPKIIDKKVHLITILSSWSAITLACTILHSSDMVPPLIALSSSFVGSAVTINSIANATFSRMRLGLLVPSAILTFFLSLNEDSLITNGIKVGLIMGAATIPANFFIDKILQSDYIKKAYDITSGTIAGSREALSWCWNLGIPKLKRNLVSLGIPSLL